MNGYAWLLAAARMDWAGEMCRSIKVLRGDEPAAPDEIEAAALQYVRKVSGYRTPSQANADAFETAVAEVSAATARLLGSLQVRRRGAA